MGSDGTSPATTCTPTDGERDLCRRAPALAPDRPGACVSRGESRQTAAARSALCSRARCPMRCSCAQRTGSCRYRLAWRANASSTSCVAEGFLRLGAPGGVRGCELPVVGLTGRSESRLDSRCPMSPSSKR
eukprot:11327621-Alexandrium_andersonii.AAC.1